MTADSVPVIDLGPLRAGDDAARLAVAHEISAACQSIGFFCIRGHGVQRATIDDAWAQARAFFARPDAEKRALAVTRLRYRGYIPLAAFSANAGGQAPDLYEGYKIHLEVAPDDPLADVGMLYGANVWPTEPAAFRPAMAAYWDAMSALGDALNVAFALALGLDEAHFRRYFAMPLSNISLLHYPPQPPTAPGGQHGIHPHRDSDAFTVLLPDAVGGLEVQRRDGRWIAPPVPGDGFVVNIGDMLECWTAGRFRSTPHRVINRTGHERYSIAFFAIPGHDTVIAPIPGLGEPARAFDSIEVGAYMTRIYTSNWDAPESDAVT